ncbi:glyoxalase [Thiohalorhabdus denitrificans]|uniref:Glyoxalase-like domain-containing protein n=1 Tax=Thiohalorhabdus denitrificans TaxID=381306 RepID=A0A0P9GLQ7_9GAMM|nr:VOC family protein [Thiohalorhabdus denitrificans]KPV41155.1 glyoxalase [Thiohalorhabdus denitrificans]SCY36316.1 Glyoxalase-like domain-containing protein [Thiohalorhabdus denitrificans]
MDEADSPITSLSAVTIGVSNMARSVAFYRGLGFVVRHGGETESFTSFYAGSGYLNLALYPERSPHWWGRVIFYVEDVDRHYRRVLERGIRPERAPEDAPWGERYFHVIDPDGHEVSFAHPL